MNDKRLLMFEDLVFKPHPTIGYPAVAASVVFENGEGISVVGGSSYLDGDGKTTFEVMSSQTNGDVLSYLSQEEVTDEMIKLQLRFLIL